MGIDIFVDVQVIVFFYMSFSILFYCASFFRFNNTDAVAFYGFKTIITYLQSTIVIDFLFHITLCTEVNEFLTTTILYGQLVKSITVRCASASKNAASLMSWQFVGHWIQTVRQAASYHGLIRIPIEKRYKDFHSYSWCCDAAVHVPGPRRCYSQPATAFVIELALAIPMEMDFDPAVTVTMNLL